MIRTRSVSIYKSLVHHFLQCLLVLVHRFLSNSLDNFISDSLDKPPRVRYVRNQSERFESRWSRVKIGKSNNIFLTDMEDSVLGIWSAHGEGIFLSLEELFNNCD